MESLDKFDNVMIIFWRTVAAFRKQCGALFSADTAGAVLRGRHCGQKETDLPNNRKV